MASHATTFSVHACMATRSARCALQQLGRWAAAPAVLAANIIAVLANWVRSNLLLCSSGVCACACTHAVPRGRVLHRVRVQCTACECACVCVCSTACVLDKQRGRRALECETVPHS